MSTVLAAVDAMGWSFYATWLAFLVGGRKKTAYGMGAVGEGLWAVEDLVKGKAVSAAFFCLVCASLALVWWRSGGDDDWRRRRRKVASWVRSHPPRPVVVDIHPALVGSR